MVITGKVFSDMIVSAANQLGNNKDILDRLNVFPVPDGDTGKNMHLTMTGAKNVILSGIEGDAIAISAKIASATLKSARGNSGVILSQLFRGLSAELSAAGEVTAKSWADALKKASDTAYKAVMKPTEGTILTVARGGADAALLAAQETDDILLVTEAALKGAKEALDNTPNLLPKLKEAGVVDAGGMGWYCILEGFYAYLSTGNIVEASESSETSSASSPEASLKEEEITFGYCTEFIIEKTNMSASVDEFRNTISPIGDCMLVIEDFDVVKVHIHTDNPGTVLQAALKIGSLINIKIDNMRYQHSENLKAEMQPEQPKERVPYSIIAVSSGSGFSEIFGELGVTRIIEGGQTMNPSAGDIADGILAENADVVYVLPNNKNIILAADAAADLVDCDVRVIPTTTVPQGISAAIAFVPDLSADENAATMTEMAKSVSTGSVTYAVRDTSSNGLEIKEGNLIALSDKSIVATGTEMKEVVSALATDICDDSTSIITIYYGEEVNESDAGEISAMLEKKFPDCDVSLQFGGQPVYYYVISAE